MQGSGVKEEEELQRCGVRVTVKSLRRLCVYAECIAV